jgi:extradiol dioxygenase family protein
MFHLSLPVIAFEECLTFYETCFGARIVMLSDDTANLFVFDGQVTFHDRPGAGLTEGQRQEMHFGHVVSRPRWREIRDRLRKSGRTMLKCIDPEAAADGRGKLLLSDPSGNLVEINSEPATDR